MDAIINWLTNFKYPVGDLTRTPAFCFFSSIPKGVRADIAIDTISSQFIISLVVLTFLETNLLIGLLNPWFCKLEAYGTTCRLNLKKQTAAVVAKGSCFGAGICRAIRNLLMVTVCEAKDEDAVGGLLEFIFFPSRAFIQRYPELTIFPAEDEEKGEKSGACGAPNEGPRTQNGVSSSPGGRGPEGPSPPPEGGDPSRAAGGSPIEHDDITSSFDFASTLVKAGNDLFFDAEGEPYFLLPGVTAEKYEDEADGRTKQIQEARKILAHGRASNRLMDEDSASFLECEQSADGRGQGEDTGVGAYANGFSAICTVWE